MDTGVWLFDALCQLAYHLPYITNTNARINSLSITAGCKELLFVAHNSQSQESVTTLLRPLVGWGAGGIWAVNSQENS